MKPYDLQHEKSIGANCSTCGMLIDFAFPGQPRTCADAVPPLSEAELRGHNCPSLVGYVPAEKRTPVHETDEWTDGQKKDLRRVLDLINPPDMGAEGSV